MNFKKAPLCIFLINCLELIFALHKHDNDTRDKDGRCECGRYQRNMSASAVIAGKQYDTLVPLGSGFDSKVMHAYSPALGHCVAIKQCSEQSWVNKCTRELEVLKALNGDNLPLEERKIFLRYFDSEIKHGLACQESSLFSDFLRVIVIGSDKKKRRRRRGYSDEGEQDKQQRQQQGQKQQVVDLDVELKNCTLVRTVMELGDANLSEGWRKLTGTAHGIANRNDAETSARMVKGQLQQSLDILHGKGIAHRDVHPENLLLFPATSSPRPASTAASKYAVKLIDFGWSCCFQPTKCGPQLASVLPACERDDALADDRFGVIDVGNELQKLMGAGAGAEKGVPK